MAWPKQTHAVVQYYTAWLQILKHLQPACNLVTLSFLTFDFYEPYGNENFKTQLLQITAEKFSNFSWIFFPMVLAKLRLGFLKFWKVNL